MLWWSSAAVFFSSVVAPVLLCIQTVWLHLCVCFQSETPISNRLSHCSLLGWLRIALDLPQHLAFGLLGLYTRASVWEYVSVRGGERVCGWTAHVGGCEVVRRREDVKGYAMCIHVYRHFSVQADSGAALTTLAVQQ